MTTSQSRLLTLIIAVSFSFNIVANAQKKGVSKAYILKKNEIVNVDALVKSADFFTFKSHQLGLGNHDEMVLKKETPGKNNYTYQKYEQYYKGVPVVGRAYTLRIKEGHVKRASGYYLPMIDLDITPSISTDQAISSAMRAMNAEKYIWQDEAMIKISNYAQLPEAKLVIIDAAYPSSSEEYALAYQVDLQSIDPMDKKRFFINAHTDKLLLDLPLLMHNAVPGKGQTKYYGEQSFTVDFIGGDNFVLRDLSRGDGNTVFNSNGEVFTDTDNFWDLTNDSQNEGAVDAHYCTEKFYDLMRDRFDWDGIDNEGGSMNSIILEESRQFIQSFWDGNAAFFGDGGCHHGPLTTFELVAHEFMHGITQNSSGLVYTDEAGAINESISDIFGKALEYYEDPNNFEWTFGHSHIETPYVTPLRSFEDPLQFFHPNFYKGRHWGYGLLHVNSSVGNHWFYLLVNGGEGVNEAGVQYSLEGIGMEKALEIVFLTQTAGLVPNSKFLFYAQVSKLATVELFGEGSEELQSIEEAWKAVGVVDGQATVDLGFTTSSIRINTCQAQSFLSFDIDLVNIGDGPYLPTMNGIVDITFENTTQANLSEVFELVDTIFPGEIVKYTIDNLWFVEGLTNPKIELNLNIEEDLGLGNNAQQIILSNNQSERDDLELRTETLDLFNRSTCLGEETEIKWRVTNKSCLNINQGTPFEVQIYDENEILLRSLAYSLPVSLATNDFFQISEFFDLNDFDAEILKAVLVYENDSNMQNNSFELDMPNIETIASVYHQSFDEEEFPEIEINEGIYHYSSIHDFENENYFATTTRIGQRFDVICPEPADLFGTYTLTMDLCVDTKGLQNPSLEFDLIQFRRLTGPSELRINSSMVSVNWEDGQNDFEDIILGQEARELIHHQYTLPNEVKGLARITFYSFQGTRDFTELSRYDAALLDNLAITDLVTSVDEVPPSQFTARPNPTTGIVTLSYADLPEEILIKNIHNVEISRVKPSLNETEFNISHLPQGVYIFSLLYEDRFTSALITKVD